MRISGLAHAASAPALLRFAFRVAIHAQGWLPVGWLAFTGRASNPLDHYERFQITWSSPFPVLLTLDSCRADAIEGGEERSFIGMQPLMREGDEDFPQTMATSGYRPCRVLGSVPQ